MAIITEDGTGLSNADSYCSVAYADTYHSNYGNSSWAGLAIAAKEAALRKAARYMVQMFRQRWAGTRVKSTQALDWPRYDVPMNDAAGGYGGNPPVWAYNVVPDLVLQACAELALKASVDGDLAPDIERLTKREKVDVIEVEYADGAPAYKRYIAVERMLAAFFGSAGSSMAVVRS